MIFASTPATASAPIRKGVYLAAGVGYGRMHAPNPILIDARRYYEERRGMNNPKGWDHVLRKVEHAVQNYMPSDLWDGATPEHVDHALRVLGRLGRTPQGSGS